MSQCILKYWYQCYAWSTLLTFKKSTSAINYYFISTYMFGTTYVLYTNTSIVYIHYRNYVLLSFPLYSVPIVISWVHSQYWLEVAYLHVEYVLSMQTQIRGFDIVLMCVNYAVLMFCEVCWTYLCELCAVLICVKYAVLLSHSLYWLITCLLLWYQAVWVGT